MSDSMNPYAGCARETTPGVPVAPTDFSKWLDGSQCICSGGPIGAMGEQATQTVYLANGAVSGANRCIETIDTPIRARFHPDDMTAIRAVIRDEVRRALDEEEDEPTPRILTLQSEPALVEMQFDYEGKRYRGVALEVKANE